MGLLVMRRIEPSEIAKAAMIWRGRPRAPLPVTAEQTRRGDGETSATQEKKLKVTHVIRSRCDATRTSVKVDRQREAHASPYIRNYGRSVGDRHHAKSRRPCSGQYDPGRQRPIGPRSTGTAFLGERGYAKSDQ